MASIHYLREISKIKKRIQIFSDELSDQCESSSPKSNCYNEKQLLLRILNELYTLKMSSIIRCKQHFNALYTDHEDIAKTFFLRTVKERYFLNQIKAEIEKAGGNTGFNPVIFTSNVEEDAYPANSAEKILREHCVVHSILIDCYLHLIDNLKSTTPGSKLLWVLKSMMAMEQKYTNTEKRVMEDLAA